MNQIADYAYPCMMAENAMKKLHDAALRRDYDAAVQYGIEALAETRLTIQNLRLMKEQEDALRKQTASV